MAPGGEKTGFSSLVGAGSEALRHLVLWKERFELLSFKFTFISLCLRGVYTGHWPPEKIHSLKLKFLNRTLELFFFFFTSCFLLVINASQTSCDVPILESGGLGCLITKYHHQFKVFAFKKLGWESVWPRFHSVRGALFRSFRMTTHFCRNVSVHDP